MEPLNNFQRIIVEQGADPVLLNFKKEKLGLPSDEQILATYPTYVHYCQKEKRNKIKDDMLCGQKYNDFGDISQLRVLLTMQLKVTLLNTLHGQAGKHLGISRIMPKIKHKYYFKSIANHVRNWLKECQT